MGKRFDRTFSSLFFAAAIQKGQGVADALSSLRKELLSHLRDSSLLPHCELQAVVGGEAPAPSEEIFEVFSDAVEGGGSAPSRAVGSLVRCRGMIQDIQSEITVMSGTSANFFASSELDEKDAGAETSYVDTAVLRVIPVPGNYWFYDAAVKTNVAGSAPCRVRAVKTDKEEGGSPALDSSSEKDEERNAEMNFPLSCTQCQLASSCFVALVNPPSSSSSPEEGQQSFHINDVCDFYGYLEAEPEASETTQSGKATANDCVALDDGAEGEEAWGWHPVDSYRKAGEKIYRLLAIAAVPISTAVMYGDDCVYMEPGASEGLQCDAALDSSRVPVPWFEEQRGHAIRYLSQSVCYGDDLVAEYLLLHLCSGVRAHTSSSPLGDVPLLLRVPPASLAGSQCAAALNTVVPIAAVCVDSRILYSVAIAHNSSAVGRKRSATSIRSDVRPLTPQYDERLSYLKSGTLQFANGTNIIFDYTDFCNASGGTGKSQLEDDKSPLHQALFSLVHECRLPIEYPFHRVELAVGVTTLTLAAVGEPVVDAFLFPLELTLLNSPRKNQKREDGIPDCYGAADVRRYVMAVRRQATLNFHAEGAARFSSEVQSAISSALVQLSEELEGWNNRSSLIHNNIFSVMTSLIGVEAATRGRRIISVSDVLHVVDLEKARMSHERNVV